MHAVDARLRGEAAIRTVGRERERVARLLGHVQLAQQVAAPQCDAIGDARHLALDHAQTSTASSRRPAAIADSACARLRRASSMPPDWRTIGAALIGRREAHQLAGVGDDRGLIRRDALQRFAIRGFRHAPRRIAPRPGHGRGRRNYSNET